MGIEALALSMTAAFFHGTLQHMPLLALVLGRQPEVEDAVLADFSQAMAKGRSVPMLVAEPGAEVTGLLIRSVNGDELARLDYYLRGSAQSTRPLPVRPTQGGPQVLAKVYMVGLDWEITSGSWSFEIWLARFGDATMAVARQLMAAFGTERAALMASRYDMLMVRESARLRAMAEASPTVIRQTAGQGAIIVHRLHEPYAKFFAVEEYDLSHRRFDGSMTPLLNRATFISGDAAVVLPYDPVRDRVLVIEQFRPGPFARGDRQPWQLEPVAGRIDPGETPQEAARREALEEAGLELQELLPIANYYPSPGAKTEFLYTFLGIADLPDSVAGFGGLAEEGEDIRVHLLAFDDLMRLVSSGEVTTGPLILSALWLASRRQDLRAQASA